MTRAHNFKKAIIKIFYFKQTPTTTPQQSPVPPPPTNPQPPPPPRPPPIPLHSTSTPRQFGQAKNQFRYEQHIAAVVVVVTIDIHTRRQQRHHRITPRIHQQIQDIQQIQRHNQMSTTISSRIITHTFSRIPLPLMLAMWAGHQH